MAYDKIVDSTALDGAMTYTADRIRNKTGTRDKMNWDNSKGFGDYIDDLDFATGSIEITENGTYDVKSKATANVNVKDNLDKRLDNSIREYTGEVGRIWYYGFANCTLLTTVNLLKATLIFDYGFAYCGKLTNITFPNLREINERSFLDCTSLTEFITPNSFDSRIRIYCFSGCSSLKKIDLYHVQEQGFENRSLNCENLETLIIRNTDFVPTLASTTFGSYASIFTTGSAYIYVPASMVDLYKEATNWSVRADRIRAIEDYPEITGG